MIGKKWLKRLLIGAGVLAALGVGGAYAGRYWIVPAVIRGRIASQIADRWDGRVKVQGVDFDWGGAVRLAGVDLYDAAGRQWVHAASVELGLRSLISTTPVLEDLITRDLSVRWHYGPGLRPPFKEAASPGGPGGGAEVDLHALRMEGCTFVLVDPNGLTQTWGFEVRGAPSPRGLAITLRQEGQPTSGSSGVSGLAVDGLIDTRANRCSLTVAMKRRFASDEVAAVLAAAGWQKALEQSLGMAGLAGGGSVDANVTVDLPLDEPLSFTVVGQADLAGWQFRDANGALAEDAQARLTFGRDRRVDVDLTGARLLNGTARGTFHAQFPPGKPVAYGGDFTVMALSLANLNQALGGRSELQKGTFTGGASFAGRSDDIGSFRAKAHGVLSDADVMRLPVLPDLFRAIGVTDQIGLNSSHAAAAVTMTGTTITLERAHLANALSALEAEKGGTIDLKTRRLDLHVVGVPLRHLTPLLKLPVISLFSNLEKKLTRLHVQGPWTGDPRSLIRVEPMANVAQGTMDFFRSAAESDGNLGEAFLRSVGEILPAR